MLPLVNRLFCLWILCRSRTDLAAQDHRSNILAQSLRRHLIFVKAMCVGNGHADAQMSRSGDSIDRTACRGLALIVAKMNMVISGSPLDETLAAAILDSRERILSARRGLLANGLSQVAAWVNCQKGLVEWVKPDGGALCCIRLNPNAFDEAGVARFWSALPASDLQIGDGAWFGESPAVLRLGFGYLPIDVLPAALDALSKAIEAAARPCR
jgi:hypothetical protein